MYILLVIFSLYVSFGGIRLDDFEDLNPFLTFEISLNKIFQHLTYQSQKLLDPEGLGGHIFQLDGSNAQRNSRRHHGQSDLQPYYECRAKVV